jgi:hypothetical protein
MPNKEESKFTWKEACISLILIGIVFLIAFEYEVDEQLGNLLLMENGPGRSIVLKTEHAKILIKQSVGPFGSSGFPSFVYGEELRLKRDLLDIYVYQVTDYGDSHKSKVISVFLEPQSSEQQSND